MRYPVYIDAVKRSALSIQTGIGVAAVRALLCACMAALGTACQERSFHSADALQEYLEGQQQESSVVERGEYRLKLLRIHPERLRISEYRAAEALLAQEIEPERSQLADSLEHELFIQGAELASRANFSLVIERVDGQDLVYSSLQNEGYEAYSTWLQELLFGLGEHITLVTSNGTTLEPIAVHMERTYGTLTGRTFFVGFQVPDSLMVSPWDKDAFVELTEFGLSTGRFQLPLPSSHPAVTLHLR